MADLSDIQAAGTTKIVGSDSSGVEQTPVQSTSNGGIHSNLRNNAGTEVGTSSDPVRVDPTGTTTQPISVSTLPLPSGASTAANQTSELTLLGAVTETAPASDTASSGLNGRLQRIAQRLTSLIALIPNVNTIAFFTRVSDGTSNLAIKSASTAAAAADPAAVVSLSPNSPLPSGTNSIGNINPDVSPATQNITALDSGTTPFVGANGQTFYTGTPTTNSAATFPITSISNVNIQASLLGAGGTLVVEVSMDGGTFWIRPTAFQPGTQSYGNSFTSPFLATINTASLTHVRVRSITSWTGTATIKIIESFNSRNVIIGDSLPTGANVIGGVTQSGTWIISLPVGASTSANQTTEIASLAILDDVPTAQNGALVKGSPAMGQLDDTSTTAATEDNVAAIRITPQRAIHSNLRNQAGTEIGTFSNPLSVSDVVNSNIGVQGAITVTTSAIEAKVGASKLTGRKALTAHNNGNVIIYWGYTSGVTTANGTPLAAGQVGSWKVGDNQSIFLIATSGSQNVRITEG